MAQPLPERRGVILRSALCAVSIEVGAHHLTPSVDDEARHQGQVEHDSPNSHLAYIRAADRRRPADQRLCRGSSTSTIRTASSVRSSGRHRPHAPYITDNVRGEQN